MKAIIFMLLVATLVTVIAKPSNPFCKACSQIIDDIKDHFHNDFTNVTPKQLRVS